jgi:hypothetical protein
MLTGSKGSFISSILFNLSKPPTTQNIAEMKDVGTDEKQKIRLVSFNCKNIKTCALIIDKLLQELADVLNVLLVCCGVEMIPYDGFPVSMVALLRKVLVIRCLSDGILCSHDVK